MASTADLQKPIGGQKQPLKAALVARLAPRERSAQARGENQPRANRQGGLGNSCTAAGGGGGGAGLGAAICRVAISNKGLEKLGVEHERWEAFVEVPPESPQHQRRKCPERRFLVDGISWGRRGGKRHCCTSPRGAFYHTIAAIVAEVTVSIVVAWVCDERACRPAPCENEEDHRREGAHALHIARPGREAGERQEHATEGCRPVAVAKVWNLAQ